MQEVFARPALLLASGGPDNARQSGAAQTQQRAECLALRAQQRASLMENPVPLAGDGQPCLENAHRASCNKPKVFFAVRTKRSPRATFLESEETRLSRSTGTLKEACMRERISLTCSGARDLRSMS